MAIEWQRVDLVAGADVALLPRWLVPDETESTFTALHAAIPWETHRLRLFGREVAAPRLSCWIGDPYTSYVYSGTRFEPHPWLPLLAELRERLQQACDTRFNSVLANLYRDGRDSMGWHSDDEPELGAQPLIASLSLGAERRFRLRRRLPRTAKLSPADTVSLVLPPGSVLRMAGATQRLYRHDLPKTRAAVGPRINLTFRWIEPR
ncbi:MAG TPA: alpha-ketoglutarate-dependent dioxygenase AlkB [Rhodanobacter sp.]|nr:alpha-ketoglutarate-dependent dioxygenase AlkB [Rhodanobacter sp.]